MSGLPFFLLRASACLVCFCVRLGKEVPKAEIRARAAKPSRVISKVLNVSRTTSWASQHGHQCHRSSIQCLSKAFFVLYRSLLIFTRFVHLRVRTTPFHILISSSPFWSSRLERAAATLLFAPRSQPWRLSNTGDCNDVFAWP